ncbi:MAG: hypothetical protein ACI9AX_002352, partial [Polaromonas sp.]
MNATFVTRTARAGLPLVIGALCLHILLVQPNHPAAMTWGALAVFPLELPVVLLALIAAGTGRIGALLRVVLVAVLMVIAVLKTADFAMFSSLSRGFNPVGDLPLVSAGLRLLTGTIGLVPGIFAVGAALVLIGIVGAVTWWATGVWARLSASSAILRGVAATGAILFAGIATAQIGDAMGRWQLPVHVPGAAFTARVGVERLQTARETLADLRLFEIAAAADPYAGAEGVLDIIDRDVVIVFVESYGRTSFDTPQFADLHRATLAAGETRLADLGLTMASGFLSSPTRGGQSWLAHATFANGLWVSDQTRYSAALVSRRQTLFHIAARAGFHTAAVMPQITL